MAGGTQQKSLDAAYRIERDKVHSWCKKSIRPAAPISPNVIAAGGTVISSSDMACGIGNLQTLENTKGFHVYVSILSKGGIPLDYTFKCK